ncbi:MAG TPA: hypothetical protein VFS00_15430 [Polyangiaceae bacterium]|nr:hypothetical protein [Polyangiaceae bacterium]
MKRTLGGALLAAALWVLGACTPPPFVSPAQGGPTWSRLTTLHFTLYTDAPADEARDTARELEEIYGALEAVGFPYSKKPKGRFEVTLFRHQDAFRQIAPPVSDGYFQRDAHDPDGRPMMVLYQGEGEHLRAILQHELTHRFVAFYFPVAPVWLNEGLARTYETLAFGGGQAEVGKVPPGRIFGRNTQIMIGADRGVTTLSVDEVPGVDALLATDWHQFYGASDGPQDLKRATVHYEAAWNLVHTLRFGPPPLREAFDDYLLALANRREPRAAFRDAMRAHGVTLPQLEAAYRQHVRQWGIPFDRVAYAPRPLPAPHVQPMGEADVHLLWARVRPWRGENAARAGAEIEAALKADPSSAIAYVLRGDWRQRQKRDQYAAALADYRKAVALAPDDSRALYALAGHLDTYVDGHPDDAAAAGELTTLLDRLRERPGSSSAFNLLAWYDARKGDPARGLPLAKQAIAANPSCFACYDTAAVLLHRLGRLPEAVEAQRNAVNLMPDGVRVPAIMSRLREFERELAAAPASSAEPASSAAPASPAAPTSASAAGSP